MKNKTKDNGYIALKSENKINYGIDILKDIVATTIYPIWTIKDAYEYVLINIYENKKES